MAGRSQTGRTRAGMSALSGTVRRQRRRSDTGHGAEARHAQGLHSGSTYASSSAGGFSSADGLETAAARVTRPTIGWSLMGA